MAQVSKDMTIAQVLQIDRGTVPIFLRFGMHCLGCPISSGETLEEASVAHGINVEELVKALNDYLKDK
ncbi:hybrid cluster-associated redox disulfide protein [Caldicoprobacter guelmensis]|uniref:DUF1858 domain-containing protein n=1 Tax=Caldicoprobacter guelmensis TaxID=1170224 RepID=UPI001956D25C|nr:DUF1858 domain-containing protein [Caldicoprobacter guelmensis]MBM7582493.1 hybrid cluster-associated redox disulfide protein [Caldicoprobacter guelmensis]